MKNIFNKFIILVALTLVGTSCNKTDQDLLSNPNTASESGTIPVSLILNHITYSMYLGGGVLDGRSGSVSETPWDQEYIWSQYYVSNYAYYRGNNLYNWSNSATMYDVLRYTIKMEQQNITQFAGATNVYSALAKFFRAYSAVWLTQRVGDIPMSQAGDINNPTPVYDSQHDVYKQSLQLLDDANTIMAGLVGTPAAPTAGTVNGDIFGLTNLQWQKVINAYTLRVLISLSKRADDNADLNIKSKFAAILATPAKYPVMTANSDNMIFKYNAAFNPYPINARGNQPYNNYANMSSTLINLLVANKDPRVFATSTPAPALLTSGKLFSDFAAYAGSDIGVSQSTLFTDGSTPATSKYSYANPRYYSSTDKSGASAEPYIFIGYPELCFNIAEGINRGWAPGDASVYYTNGINASLAFLSLVDTKPYNVNDISGKVLGAVTIDIAGFLKNTSYQGGAAGLNQILTQKYLAFFNNSGWESFYNWRRTGVPTFSEGGVGIGTPSSKIPRRWQYPQDEVSYNSANYQSAIQSQFGGVDDITKELWLTK